MKLAILNTAIGGAFGYIGARLGVEPIAFGFMLLAFTLFVAFIEGSFGLLKERDEKPWP